MKNTVGYKINSNSRAIDILRDKDFLRLLRIFILEFEPSVKDEKLLILKKQFSSENFLTDFDKKDDNDLFYQILEFLSDEFIKPIFFEYLENYNLDQKYLNLFLEVGDFLEKTYVDSTEYPEGFYNVSDKYKTKITDILGKKELTDPQYQLLQIGYPIISPFSSAIIDVDINNSFTKKSILGGEDIYIYCRDNQNNIFYMNYLGELLKDSNDKIIKHIETKELKAFGVYNIFKFINVDNESKVGIISKMGIGKIIELEADDFSVNNFSYTEDALGDDGIEIYEKEEILELLHIDSRNGDYYLNKKLSRINLLNVFEFINKNNPALINNVKKTLDKFSEIDVEKIYKIYNYSGVKFIELEVETESYIDEFGNSDYEINHCVMLENGKALVEKQEFGQTYIRSLGDKDKIFDYEFVSFQLTQRSKKDGYIDSFGNIVYIDGYRLISFG